MIFCDSVIQTPFQEIANAFFKETGCVMNVTYASSRQIQTMISEYNQGAFFIASPQEEVKPVNSHVMDITPLVKLTPVLAVAAGNPKNINGIADLARNDIVTAIGDPKSTPIGNIAMIAFRKYKIKGKVNLADTTTADSELSTLISMGEADAAIICKENSEAEGVEICETNDMDAYIQNVSAARLIFDGKSEIADDFLTFLNSKTTKKIWQKYGFELAE